MDEFYGERKSFIEKQQDAGWKLLRNKYSSLVYPIGYIVSPDGRTKLTGDLMFKKGRTYQCWEFIFEVEKEVGYRLVASGDQFMEHELNK